MLCETHNQQFSRPECHNARCGEFATGYVYGLYDARVGDMFYVGSTVRPERRYSEHMRAANPSNFRKAWIMTILSDGSQPLFCSLYEFRTHCEIELKEAERAIARELRAMGHTAMCDGHWFPQNRSRYACPCTEDALPTLDQDVRLGLRWDFIEQVIAEHLAMVNEQARVMRWLREI